MAVKRILVLHPESPGVTLWVRRGFWGRLFKPADFATLSECIRSSNEILQGRISPTTGEDGDE